MKTTTFAGFSVGDRVKYIGDRTIPVYVDGVQQQFKLYGMTGTVRKIVKRSKDADVEIDHEWSIVGRFYRANLVNIALI